MYNNPMGLDKTFGLAFHLLPYFMYATSNSSGQTAWVFAGPLNIIWADALADLYCSHVVNSISLLMVKLMYNL